MDDEYRLVDYLTKDPLASNLALYPIFFDSNKELFYGWSSYWSQTYLTQMDAKGNITGRIPSYESEITLSQDGKYIFLYDKASVDLFRINTAIFNSKIQLTVD